MCFAHVADQRLLSLLRQLVLKDTSNEFQEEQVAREASPGGETFFRSVQENKEKLNIGVEMALFQV